MNTTTATKTARIASDWFIAGVEQRKVYAFTSVNDGRVRVEIYAERRDGGRFGAERQTMPRDKAERMWRRAAGEWHWSRIA